MDDQQVVRTDLELPHQPVNRLPTPVHISLGPGHNQTGAIHFPCAGAGSSLSFVKPDTLTPGKVVEAHESQVMTILFMVSARITKADNQSNVRSFPPEDAQNVYYPSPIFPKNAVSSRRSVFSLSACFNLPAPGSSPTTRYLVFRVTLSLAVPPRAFIFSAAS